MPLNLYLEFLTNYCFVEPTVNSIGSICSSMDKALSGNCSAICSAKAICSVYVFLQETNPVTKIKEHKKFISILLIY